MSNIVMNDPKISEMTLSELKSAIRETVQEAVAEVLIEFAIASEIDAQITEDAEMADYLRSTMQSHGLLPSEFASPRHLDD